MNNKKLIQLVKEYPILYDINHEYYTAQSKKDGCWMKISEALRMPVYQCKQNWFQLRDAYRGSLRKRTILNVAQMKKFKYEDDLKFLDPKLRSRPITPLLEDSYDEELEQLLEVPMDLKVPTDDETESVSSHPSSSETVEESTKTNVSNTVSSAALMQYIMEMKKKDDLDLTLAALACTIRKFPQHEQALVKSKMQRVVSKIEIKLASRIEPNFESPPPDYPSEQDYVDTNNVLGHFNDT